MSQDYARALGRRLRSVRLQQGLTLQGVEAKSDGRWKAIVVGSYERADRAITVTRLTELAEFYGVPPTLLLPDARSVPPNPRGPELVLDLQRLLEVPSQLAGPLARYAAVVQSQRADVADKGFAIRSEDVRSLAVVCNLPAQTLTDQLIDCGVLSAATKPF